MHFEVHHYFERHRPIYIRSVLLQLLSLSKRQLEAGGSWQNTIAHPRMWQCKLLQPPWPLRAQPRPNMGVRHLNLTTYSQFGWEPIIPQFCNLHILIWLVDVFPSLFDAEDYEYSFSLVDYCISSRKFCYPQHPTGSFPKSLPCVDPIGSFSFNPASFP